MDEVDKIIREIDPNGISIQLLPDGAARKITRFGQLKEFIEEERVYWKKYSNSQLINLVSNFDLAQHEIAQAEHNIQSNNSKAAKDNILRSIRILKENIKCYSSTPTAIFIDKLYKINSETSNGAYDYFISNHVNPNSLTNIHYLNGVMKSFAYKELIKTFSEKEDAGEAATVDLRNKYAETIDNLDGTFHSKVKSLDESTNTFKNELSEWKKSIIDNLNLSLEIKQKNFNDLQKQYEEYMRLEGPAKYWENMHKDYEINGKRWRNWSIVSTVIVSAFLTGVLYKFPECLMQEGASFSLTGLRGVIILAVIVSVLVYLIRLFVKLSISSYHLSRDAKERLQLTHIYISMIKDKSVDEKDRSIVLQSLFSRSDTGLLKGDHSPTLPDGLIKQISRNIVK